MPAPPPASIVRQGVVLKMETRVSSPIKFVAADAGGLLSLPAMTFNVFPMPQDQDGDRQRLGF
jgi:hypothetical protein